jgi:hypothetical protein
MSSAYYRGMSTGTTNKGGERMKTYNQLTVEQKQKALDKEIESLVKAIMEGAIRFNDKKNKDNLQARIDAAWKKAERMQTPWFAGSYIMDTCKDEITGMAQCVVEDALYPESSETVIECIA